MKEGKLKQIVKNMNLRGKLFLSYAVVGILPFIICSSYIISLTNKQLKVTEQNRFDSVFYNCSTSLRKNIEKVETVANIIATDAKMAEILNTNYENYYQKYIDITQDLDSVVETIRLTNPQLSEIHFYVNDSLAFIRGNFHQLSDLEEGSFFRFDCIDEVQWGYSDNCFLAYRKIFTPFSNANYAVLELVIPQEELLNPQIFAGMSYELTLGEEVIISTAERSVDNYGSKTESVGAQGKLTGYMEKNYNAGVSRKNLWIIAAEICFAFAFLIIVINRFSAKFSYRIHTINRALARTVANNFSITLEEDYQDEIGELTKYINGMIKDTKKLIHDVYESKIKQREYEMKALQAQINPHFLYNTLSAINWHALKTDNSEISEIVTALSRFYRTALNSGNNVTNVGKELENIKAYLRIQQSIHSDSFEVVYEIEERVFPYRMPNLILQPIIENAIEHGIDLKTEGVGKLVIRAWKEGEFLIFEISDNGPGIPEEKMDNLLSQNSKSYGLRNVNKRLQLFYGEKYSLEYFNEDGTTFRLRVNAETEEVK